jgi:hypothetical protein
MAPILPYGVAHTVAGPPGRAPGPPGTVTGLRAGPSGLSPGELNTQNNTTTTDSEHWYPVTLVPLEPM